MRELEAIEYRYAYAYMIQKINYIKTSCSSREDFTVLASTCMQAHAYAQRAMSRFHEYVYKFELHELADDDDVGGFNIWIYTSGCTLVTVDSERELVRFECVNVRVDPD